MRLFEIIILILLLGFVIWPIFLMQRPRWYYALPMVAALLVVLHLLIEGFRWQMWPAYLLTILLTIVAAIAMRRNQDAKNAARRWPGIVGAVLGLLGWAVAAVLPWALPVPSLPEPKGDFAVGTISYHLIDENRPENYSDDPNDSRQFMVQLWYPAEDIAEANRAPYIDQAQIAAPILASSFGFPPFLFDHLNLASNFSYLDAPINLAGPFPIIVFSHGLTGFRGQNSFQMEELASQGYVVASIDHTYGSRSSIFPDGTVIEYDAAKAFPPGVENAGNILIKTWAGDISYLFDEMELWVEGSGSADKVDWTGRLDLDNIGIFGHSTGGGTAIEFCSSDNRCDVALGLDAWIEPVSDSVRESGLQLPLMFISSSEWSSDSNSGKRATLYEASAADKFDLIIADTDHYDFTDFPGFSPLTPSLGIAVTENGTLAQDATQAYTLAFFNQYLRGSNEPLLNGPSSDYPTINYQFAIP